MNNCSFYFTRDDVCHTFDQRQVRGTNTRGWAEAHLQQEVTAVTTFPCAQQNRCKVGHEMGIKHEVQKKG